MSEPTLESLAARVAELERKVATLTPQPQNWEKVIGMFADSPIMPEIIAEGRAYRESLRREAEEEADRRDREDGAK